MLAAIFYFPSHHAISTPDPRAVRLFHDVIDGMPAVVKLLNRINRCLVGNGAINLSTDGSRREAEKLSHATICL